jgi:adenine-specific DNA-methyltransferase
MSRLEIAVIATRMATPLVMANSKSPKARQHVRPANDRGTGDAAVCVNAKSVRSLVPGPHECLCWNGTAESLLAALPSSCVFDLVVTSPPYNIRKEYESQAEFATYLEWQQTIIDLIVPRLRVGGSLCWQVGNYVVDNAIFPLDIELAPFFRNHGLILRNRIVWRFGHGLHARRRFSGRYEVVMWYTRTPSAGSPYTFNLDAVRVPSKYPGKRAFKGPRAGQLSGNPLGKNPEDVWDIPNVKSNHCEKTAHPCQFPVGLIERLVLALTNPGDLVFDPFAGVASSGVASAIHGRRFLGAETRQDYCKIGIERMTAALRGEAVYRPHDVPLYDHTKSPLSKRPPGGGPRP